MSIVNYKKIKAGLSLLLLAITDIANEKI